MKQRASDFVGRFFRGYRGPSGSDVSVVGGEAAADAGNGGAVVLQGGTQNGAGAEGPVISRSLRLRKQGAPAAKTTSTQLTAAELINGLITVNQGGGGASNLQLPTAANLDLALPHAQVDDSFEFSLINISTVAAEDATITTASGWTLVGTMVVESNEGTAQKGPSGRFQARKTAAGAWTLYRQS